MRKEAERSMWREIRVDVDEGHFESLYWEVERDDVPNEFNDGDTVVDEATEEDMQKELHMLQEFDVHNVVLAEQGEIVNDSTW